MHSLYPTSRVMGVHLSNRKVDGMNKRSFRSPVCPTRNGVSWGPEGASRAQT